jgi:hypothetical protein
MVLSNNFILTCRCIIISISMRGWPNNKRLTAFRKGLYTVDGKQHLWTVHFTASDNQVPLLAYLLLHCYIYAATSRGSVK